MRAAARSTQVLRTHLPSLTPHRASPLTLTYPRPHSSPHLLPLQSFPRTRPLYHFSALASESLLQGMLTGMIAEKRSLVDWLHFVDLTGLSVHPPQVPVLLAVSRMLLGVDGSKASTFHTLHPVAQKSAFSSFLT